MPTNILRARHTAIRKREDGKRPPAAAERIVRITAGGATIRASLLDTPTANRVWAALPIFSTVEMWGTTLHFKTVVETGRERSARILINLGDICFWPERDRIAIAFGSTPISRPGELRMPQPSNVWARAIDDINILKLTRPGEKVAITAAQD